MGRLAVIAAAGLLSLAPPALGDTRALLAGTSLVPVAPAPPALPALVPPPPPVLTDVQASREAGRIAAALRAEVPATVFTTGWRRQRND